MDTRNCEATRPTVDTARDGGSSAERILVLGGAAILAGVVGLGYAARARSSRTAAVPR